MADHSIIVEIGANISQLTQSLNSAQNQIQQFSGAFDAIKDVGKTLTGIGIAGAAGIGLAVNSAATSILRCVKPVQLLALVPVNLTQ